VIFINRNVAIVIVILVLVVIAGYLVWLRSKVEPSATPQPEAVQVTPTPTVTPTASPSATPGASATGSAKPKTSTSSGVKQ